MHQAKQAVLFFLTVKTLSKKRKDPF